MPGGVAAWGTKRSKEIQTNLDPTSAHRQAIVSIGQERLLMSAAKSNPLGRQDLPSNKSNKPVPQQQGHVQTGHGATQVISTWQHRIRNLLVTSWATKATLALVRQRSTPIYFLLTSCSVLCLLVRELQIKSTKGLFARWTKKKNSLLNNNAEKYSPHPPPSLPLPGRAKPRRRKLIGPGVSINAIAKPK